MLRPAGIIVGVFIFLAGGLSWAQAQTTLPAEQVRDTGQSRAVVIDLDGQVDNYMRDQIFRRFAQARQMGAQTIILRIDTYGGLVTAGLEISQFLKSQDDLHIIAYVPSKAISAGVMIALAADEIVMGPSAKIGDSAPIAITPTGGLQELPPAERAKMESPILSDFYESALRNGYDPLLVESMVAVGRTVYWIEDDAGQRRFVNESQYAQLTQDGAWHAVAGVRSPIDGPDTLLTVHTELAIQLGLARQMVRSVEQLAQERHLQVIGTLSNSAGDYAVQWLGSSGVRFVLFIIFLMSLYTALHAPGQGMAEALAAISLTVLVGVPLLTGYAQWWELGAILVGLALLALEVFVIPGFGVAGLSGIALVLVGFIMTFVPKEPGGMPGVLPQMGQTWNGLQTGLWVVFGGLLCSLVLWFWLSKYLPKLPYFNKLVLTEVSGTPAAAPLPATEAAQAFPSIGAVGTVVTDLKPGGTIEIFEEATGVNRQLDAVSDDGFVVAGQKVAVRELRGNYVIVRVIGGQA